MSGSPRPLLPRSSAATLENMNCTPGKLRSISASLIKTGRGFEKSSACDIDDSRDMKKVPCTHDAVTKQRPNINEQIHRLMRPGRHYSRCSVAGTYDQSMASKSVPQHCGRHSRGSSRCL